MNNMRTHTGTNWHIHKYCLWGGCMRHLGLEGRGELYLMLGKTEGKGRRGGHGWMTLLTQET